MPDEDDEEDCKKRKEPRPGSVQQRSNSLSQSTLFYIFLIFFKSRFHRFFHEKNN